MGKKMKFTIPPNSIHDIRYHYNVIFGISQKGGRVESNNRTIEYFRTLINNHNDSKASKFGFSFKPREVHIETVKDIVYELKKLSMISEEEKWIVLKEEGNQIASLIEQKDSKQLKRAFTRIMLDNYTIIPHFLRQIREVSLKREIPIPFITKKTLDKYENNPKDTLKECLSFISAYCPSVNFDVSELYDMLKSKNVDSMDKRVIKLKTLQATIEKYVILNIFETSIGSRRLYDVIRSRTSYLEFTNYGIFNIDGYSAEILYLISDFGQSFPHTQEKIAYRNGTIYVHRPMWEEIKETFKISVLNNYKIKRDSLGYAKISDVRDLVCRELKISDGLFDLFLKKLYKEESQWLSFTYFGAEDKITEKCRPLVFKKPMRQLFTRFRINTKMRR